MRALAAYIGALGYVETKVLKWLGPTTGICASVSLFHKGLL
jgi:hypothetical protein